MRLVRSASMVFVFRNHGFSHGGPGAAVSPALSCGLEQPAPGLIRGSSALIDAGLDCGSGPAMTGSYRGPARYDCARRLPALAARSNQVRACFWSAETIAPSKYATPRK